MIMLTTEACLNQNHLVFEVSGTNNYMNQNHFCCPLVWQHFAKVFNSIDSSTLLFPLEPKHPCETTALLFKQWTNEMSNNKDIFSSHEREFISTPKGNTSLI